MKKKNLTILMTALSFALILLVFSNENVKFVFKNESNEEIIPIYIPNSSEIHDPILIDGNDELTVFVGNEGLEGNGTYQSPYIFEDFNINSSTENGIDISNIDKYVKIRNCTVMAENYGYYGIVLRNCVNVVLINNTLFKNKIGIGVLSSSNNIVSKNNVIDNDVAGISLQISDSTSLSENNISSNIYYGILTGNSVNITISLNEIYYNNMAGIYMMASCENYTISKNIINFNHNLGLKLYKGNNNSFIENDIYYNGNGISIDLSNKSTFLRNNVCYNENLGILIDESNDNFLNANNINNNDYHGLKLDYSDINVLLRNNVINNTDTGIYVRYSNDNLISTNYINNNNHGIYVSYSEESYINENNVSYNIDTGITLQRSFNTTIFQNDIYENQGVQADEDDESANNRWDNGIIGNYWGDDYENRYPNAINTGSIWNTPYEINGTGEGIDNYPLKNSAFSPLIVSVSNNFNVTVNYTGLDIFWTVVNLNSATYTIELNGTATVSSTECVSGEKIYYNIPDGLLEGDHYITIIILDEMGNKVQNTVIFTVNSKINKTPESDPTSSVSGPSLIFLVSSSILGLIGIAFSMKRKIKS